MVYPLYQQFICHFITNTIGFVFSVVAFSQAHQPNPLQRYNIFLTHARKIAETYLFCVFSLLHHLSLCLLRFNHFGNQLTNAAGQLKSPSLNCKFSMEKRIRYLG